MARHGTPWSRQELDRLEALRLEERLTIAQISQRMGRTQGQVRGAIERLRLSVARKARQREDWPLIDPIIRDCLEVELMSAPQIARRLATLGHTVSRDGVLGRIKKMGREAENRLRRNVARRRADGCRRRALRQRAQKAQNGGAARTATMR